MAVLARRVRLGLYSLSGQVRHTYILLDNLHLVTVTR
jgi:hypothetical protein